MKRIAPHSWLKTGLAPVGLALSFALLAGANGDNGCAEDEEPVTGATCAAATDCKGDPGVDCLGAWSCVEGACAFECTSESPEPKDCIPGLDCPAECDPSLMCTQAETCVDGLLYPTGCGPKNCDAPIGPCEAGQCDPTLACGEALTCVDGQLYPTTCGSKNCDAPIGPCEEEQCDPTLLCGGALTCVDGQLYPTTCGPKNCDAPIGPCEVQGCDPSLCAEGERCGSMCEVVCPECPCAPGESCACPCYEECKVGCFAGCTSDRDCDASEVCHFDACGPDGCSGICAPGEKPYDCKSDSDCIDAAGQMGVCQLDHCESAAPPCDPSQESCDALPPACYGFCEFAGPITCDPNGSTCPAGTRCEAVSSCGGPGFGIPCMLEYQCVPDAPKSCTSDCDCDPALACSDGQCVPMGRLNECEVRACETDSDCADGEYCGCGSDPSCPMCDVCLFQCMPKPVDQGCYQDSDCKPGYQCEMTTCDPSRPCPAAGQCVPVDDGACIRTGCSGQVCASEMVASTCEYAEWYECYDLARCGLNAAGLCGWEPNEDFLACMRARGGPVP
jgi:eight-cysteine-cluster-containing protein